MQRESTPSFNRANRAYVAFSKGKLPPSTARKDLAAAEGAMRSTRDRIQRLAAPAEARELQRRLVALFDADAAFAHETTLLAGFIPASVAALKPLNRIGKTLTTELGHAKGAAPQAAALTRYAAATQRVIRRLQPLQPPPILLARHSAQVEHLIAARRLALSLAGALKAKASSRVARLLLRFRRLNAGGPAQTLDPNALHAYDRRYLALRRAEQAVERERRRLEGTISG